MYFTGDEEIAKNLQRKLNSPGAGSPVRGIEKENVHLTDSILEYNDPTPNIHDLFVLFDKKFFWGKLGMVEVKWSNRMTSCAGLCCYHGKGGLCSIKLSAPLLSLRPRKDLVETLLHEMIHAYLFVTENFSDRNDHGPEFHKHMYRINKIAGTKISVYHTFLDEVAYYQKHIWRCDGPCQHKRPYFGFVKRAMNRAPGPYDTWWKEHQQNCGGNFIKVSEPEKQSKKKSGMKQDHNVKTVSGMKDIRDFFPTDRNQTIFPSPDKKEFKSSNIYTIKDIKSTTSPVNNIVKPVSQPNLKPPVEKTKPVIKIPGKEVDIDSSVSVKATVRNVWANKYPSPSDGGKRDSMSPIMSGEVKIEIKRRQILCPICDLSVSETMITEHVEECLIKGKSKQSLDDTLPVDEVVNNRTVPTVSPQKAKEAEEDQKLKISQCPVCNKVIDQKDLDEHLEICLKCTFVNEEFDKIDDVVCDNVPCPCCMKWYPERNINSHIDECLTIIALKNGFKND